MGIVNTLQNFVSSEEPSDEGEEQQDPSHRCQTCGKEYYTDSWVEIDTCMDCGGVKVEPVD